MKPSVFRSYMYYLARARSEFYVHSPFVYALMTRCINGPGKRAFESRDKLFDRLGQYLEKQYGRTRLVRCTEKASISAFAAKVPETIGDADTKCTRRRIADILPMESIVVFVDKPYATAQREKEWNDACAQSDITLTIDLFRVGIVFPFRDMEKEHFCLRYF